MSTLNYVTSGSETVVLGSGDLYALPVSQIVDVFNLTEAEKSQLIYLGFIEANSTLTTSIDKDSVKAANAGKIFSFTKDKTVSFSTGIFSWNLNNVAQLLTGSDVVTDTVTGKTTFTYAHEDKSPDVYLRFVSADESANKKITVNMFKCSFSGELKLEFSTEDPVTFDYSFDVLALKNSTRNKHDYYNIVTENITTEG